MCDKKWMCFRRQLWLGPCCGKKSRGLLQLGLPPSALCLYFHSILLHSLPTMQYFQLWIYILHFHAIFLVFTCMSIYTTEAWKTFFHQCIRNNSPNSLNSRTHDWKVPCQGIGSTYKLTLFAIFPNLARKKMIYIMSYFDFICAFISFV